MQKSVFLLLAVSLAGSAAAQAAPAKPGTPAAGQPAAQQPAPNATPQAPAPPAEPATAPDEAVITVEGLCNVKLANSKPVQPTPPCTRKITRAEFERLFRPPDTPLQGADVRQSIARRYTDLLLAANEGERMNGEADKDVQQQLEIQRLTAMAQFAQRKLAKEAQNVSDEQAKAYYDAHPNEFDEVTLTRVFIPRSSSSGKDVDTKQLADQVQQQLIAGGDPEKIQKAVYDALKTTSEPPTTKFGAKRRGALPPQHDTVFTLNPGQVSSVLSDPIGYVVYKVDAKRTVPFAEVKEEAKRNLAIENFKKEEERIRSAVKIQYNEQYFAGNPGTPAAGAGAAPASTPKTAVPPATKTQPAPQRKPAAPAPK